MKKIGLAILLSSILLQAQVIPAINSKGGAMTLPKGKLKIIFNYIIFFEMSLY